MPQGKFLYYSVNPKLAYQIGLRFFKGRFYVHCAEEYDSSSTNPPSSNPAFLYQEYRQVVASDNLDYPKVASTKEVLKAAAYRKCFVDGQISQDEYDSVIWQINGATAADFAPLIYLISRDLVKNKIQQVKKQGTVEYIIDDLRQEEFDVISGNI